MLVTLYPWGKLVLVAFKVRTKGAWGSEAVLKWCPARSRLSSSFSWDFARRPKFLFHIAQWETLSDDIYFNSHIFISRPYFRLRKGSVNIPKIHVLVIISSHQDHVTIDRKVKMVAEIMKVLNRVNFDEELICHWWRLLETILILKAIQFLTEVFSQHWEYCPHRKSLGVEIILDGCRVNMHWDGLFLRGKR